jgi:hypothetical protein
METDPFLSGLATSPGEAALYLLSSLSHSTLHNSHYSLRAHCIGGDIRLYFVLPRLALVTLGAHAFG